MEPETDRRTLLKNGLSAAVYVALAHLLSRPRVLAARQAEPFEGWTRDLRAKCRDLKRHSLTPSEWQREIETLLSSVDLDELLAAIRFSELEKQLDYPELGVDTTRVRLPGLEDSAGRVFAAKLFGMNEDRAIIPHGHRNMASAHLVIGGEFHLRQYERVEREDEALIVRPTVDRSIEPGHVSSISDEKNNVHWLIARGGRAYTLDVIVTGIESGVAAYDIDNLDADRAETLDDGLLRMPVLTVEEGLRRYGHDHHGRDA